MNEFERYLFGLALSKWGQKNQLDQADEELHELAIELHKIRRGRNTGLSELAGEVADVSVMLDQIKVCFGSDFELEVEAIRQKKVDRLTQRVMDSQHKGN